LQPKRILHLVPHPKAEFSLHPTRQMFTYYPRLSMHRFATATPFSSSLHFSPSSCHTYPPHHNSYLLSPALTFNPHAVHRCHVRPSSTSRGPPRLFQLPSGTSAFRARHLPSARGHSLEFSFRQSGGCRTWHHPGTQQCDELYLLRHARSAEQQTLDGHVDPRGRTADSGQHPRCRVYQARSGVRCRVHCYATCCLLHRPAPNRMDPISPVLRHFLPIPPPVQKNGLPISSPLLTTVRCVPSLPAAGLPTKPHRNPNIQNIPLALRRPLPVPLRNGPPNLRTLQHGTHHRLRRPPRVLHHRQPELRGAWPYRQERPHDVLGRAVLALRPGRACVSWAGGRACLGDLLLGLRGGQVEGCSSDGYLYGGVYDSVVVGGLLVVLGGVC